ncbi:uncharacterized protein UTRI_10064 [Ustilago trichophora]|uniref:Uncharacterized protein n=1 Tax=Ustilago trichophora TaxID=86804 RepID=A0A5C3DTV7_9BASI|nr:uncharacterized protein UTRI_10064 [Ustilago trichophora]
MSSSRRVSTRSARMGPTATSGNGKGKGKARESPPAETIPSRITAASSAPPIVAASSGAQRVIASTAVPPVAVSSTAPPTLLSSRWDPLSIEILIKCCHTHICRFREYTAAERSQAVTKATRDFNWLSCQSRSEDEVRRKFGELLESRRKDGEAAAVPTQQCKVLLDQTLCAWGEPQGQREQGGPEMEAKSKACTGRVSQDLSSAAGDLILNARQHQRSHTPSTIGIRPHKRARLTPDDVEIASTDSSTAARRDEIAQLTWFLGELVDDSIMCPGPLSDRMKSNYERCMLAVARQIYARMPREDNGEDEMEDEEQDEEEVVFLAMAARRMEQEIFGDLWDSDSESGGGLSLFDFGDDMSLW